MPLDELALDRRGQRRVLARLGIRPEDGTRSLAELCGERMLDPITTLRLLELLCDEEEPREDVPELMALADLCRQWERRHHGQLKSELAAVGARVLSGKSTDLPNAPFWQRLDRFHNFLAGHLKWEARLWRSLRRMRPPRALTRVVLLQAEDRARSEHRRAEEMLSELSEDVGAREARENDPTKWNDLRPTLDRLQSLLQAQIHREQRWIYPRLVTEAPID